MQEYADLKHPSSNELTISKKNSAAATFKMLFYESFCITRVLFSDVGSETLLVGEVDPSAITPHDKEAP